jgi:hypothetical protein
VPGTIYHKVGTFESVLAFVESNWNLPSLTNRDAQANNLMDAFQFPGSALPGASNQQFSPPAPAKILPLLPEPKLSRRQIRRIENEIHRDKVNDIDHD